MGGVENVNRISSSSTVLFPSTQKVENLVTLCRAEDPRLQGRTYSVLALRLLSPVLPSVSLSRQRSYVGGESSRSSEGVYEREESLDYCVQFRSNHLHPPQT